MKSRKSGIPEPELEIDGCQQDFLFKIVRFWYSPKSRKSGVKVLGPENHEVSNETTEIQGPGTSIASKRSDTETKRFQIVPTPR